MGNKISNLIKTNILIRRIIGFCGMAVVFVAIGMTMAGITTWWGIIIQIVGYTCATFGWYWILKEYL